MGDIPTRGDVEVRIRGLSEYVAEVTSDGRLKIAQDPPAPPPETDLVKQTAYGSVSGQNDNVYVIPDGKILFIQRLNAGSEYCNGSSVVELWFDPNGNGTNMTIIDAIFTNGNSDQHLLAEEIEGNGTKAIRMRRRTLTGGSYLIFGRWEGYLK